MSVLDGPMGGWTGRRCRICDRWVWGGPTACERCVKWNEALNAADVAVIAAPSALKTTNNVPNYFQERGVVIDAIRGCARTEEPPR